MPFDHSHLDPRCKSCEAKDCKNCTRFGTKLLLVDPPISPGKSIKRIRTAGGQVQYIFEEPQKTGCGEKPCCPVKSGRPLDKSQATDYNQK